MPSLRAASSRQAALPNPGGDIGGPIAQVSKSADHSLLQLLAQVQQVGKPAKRQTWKSALRLFAAAAARVTAFEAAVDQVLAWFKRTIFATGNRACFAAQLPLSG